MSPNPQFWQILTVQPKLFEYSKKILCGKRIANEGANFHFLYQYLALKEVLAKANDL